MQQVMLYKTREWPNEISGKLEVLMLVVDYLIAEEDILYQKKYK
jgi:hypothetical protein